MKYVGEGGEIHIFLKVLFNGEIQRALPCGFYNEIDKNTEKLTKRIKQIEEEKMNKQSGSNRAASARPQQCILPEFSPLVLGGAPQPQPPPC